MADIDLGQKVKSLNVDLTQDADFVATMRRRDGTDWPTGLEVKLKFSDSNSTEFVADVAGPTISWTIDKDVVNSLIDRKPLTVQLLYTDPSVGAGLDLVWAVGRPTIVRLA
jgi:hypothetical protein